MLSKLPDTGTTIFSVMSALAAEHGAINLSQGFPNYSSSPLLFELVKKYMDEGYNQYALMKGALPLRKAIAQKIQKSYGTEINPDSQIGITAGATQAIFTAIQAIVHPGDEVIVFDPAFDIYVPSITLSGGRAVRIPLVSPEFRIDWDAVKSAVNSRTKAIIINSPHNPTGSILSREDMQNLENIVLQNDLYLISDEVYEHLVFDNAQHESVLRYDKLFERSIACFSFGKTFHNTGWKVGYAVAPTEIMAEFLKVHQFVVFSVNRPVQFALADYLQDESTYSELHLLYQEKRNDFNNHLKDSGFKYIPTAGTYFQLLDYSELSQKNDVEFARELVADHGVAAIPLSPFYAVDPGQRMLRFCFAKTNDILEKAAERLCRI